jgi:hypothetical protein
MNSRQPGRGGSNQSPGEIRVLAWIIGLAILVLLGIWPGLAARGYNAAGNRQWGTNSWIAEGVYFGAIAAITITIILVRRTGYPGEKKKH